MLIGAAAAWVLAVSSSAAVSAQAKGAEAKMKNPVKPTQESVDAGKATYNKYCKFCHNEGGTGNGPLAPKGTHPPDLVDATWDHGSTDGEIFTNIKEGIGPKFDMKPMKAKMSDTDIWNVINYLRSLGPKK
ncbi:MAG TPA: cytochrome c [Vicinamibacterales bacterium]|nr:cytochrome c [Vicinamibacterales bacterium]